VSGFQLTRQSIADLSEIWDYIAEDNLDAADHLLDKFNEALASLAAIHSIPSK